MSEASNNVFVSAVTMARFHVRATPPVSQLLFEYGRDFPSFIESYEYARDTFWLADTARIERAWLDAYHAADAAPIKAEALVRLDCCRRRSNICIAAYLQAKAIHNIAVDHLS